MGRTDERGQIPVEIRVQLLEGDQDRNDTRLLGFDAQLDRIKGMVLGVLCSVTAGAVLVAIDIAVRLR